MMTSKRCIFLSPSFIIKSVIVEHRHKYDCDTTPNISHQEQFCICARIVYHSRICSEYFFSCLRNSGTIAMELYNELSATLTPTQPCPLIN